MGEWKGFEGDAAQPRPRWGAADRGEELRGVKRQYALREVHYHTEDDGSVVIKARLPAEEGTLVLKALEAGAEALWKEARGWNY